MQHNTIYHPSTPNTLPCKSSNSTFLTYCPRVADSPTFQLDFPTFKYPPPAPTPIHIRAPRSPYNLRTLPLENYSDSQPNITFPP